MTSKMYSINDEMHDKKIFYRLCPTCDWASAQSLDGASKLFGLRIFLNNETINLPLK